MKNKKIYIILSVLLIFFGLYFKFSFNSKNDEIIDDGINAEEILLSVDIKGAVKNPGVYKLNEGTVVNDAINISGGLLDTASTEYINLGKRITDEMVIIIYTNDEIKEMTEGSTSIKVIDTECICPKIENNACIEDSQKYTNSEVINNSISSDKISLNNASKEELMTLNGIGESKANAIIEYRNTNGSFKNIEEITNVKGIGNSIYEKIKDKLTL